MFVQRRQPLPILLLLLLCALLATSLNASAAEGETAQQITERYEKERKALEAKWAEEKRQKALDQKQVAEDMKGYSFPQQQSRCDDFVVDWSQIATVQTYIQMSLAHAKNLGNCRHAETKANVESLASDMAKANIGTTKWSWSGEGMPDSIQSISPFANFSANFDRCNEVCFKTFNGLLDKAADISMVKRDAFLAQWDNYTENNIKAAMKQQNPEAYAQNNVDQEFANIRMALKHFAFQRNELDQ